MKRLGDAVRCILRGVSAAGLLTMLLPPMVVAGQSGGVVLSFSAGVNAPAGGSRYEDTGSGYVLEGAIGVALSDSWQVAAGGEWGTFDAEVPEFIVFAPFDHSPWLEYSLLYGRVSYLFGSASGAVRPFLRGRLGWLSELAEYSGAKVSRSGLATGASAGIGWRATSRLTLQVDATLLIASLGAPTFEGLGGAASSGSRARYGKLSAGLDVRVGS